MRHIYGPVKKLELWTRWKKGNLYILLNDLSWACYENKGKTEKFSRTELTETEIEVDPD